MRGAALLASAAAAAATTLAGRGSALLLEAQQCRSGATLFLEDEECFKTGGTDFRADCASDAPLKAVQGSFNLSLANDRAQCAAGTEVLDVDDSCAATSGLKPVACRSVPVYAKLLSSFPSSDGSCEGPSDAQGAVVLPSGQCLQTTTLVVTVTCNADLSGGEMTIFNALSCAELNSNTEKFSATFTSDSCFTFTVGEADFDAHIQCLRQTDDGSGGGGGGGGGGSNNDNSAHPSLGSAAVVLATAALAVGLR